MKDFDKLCVWLSMSDMPTKKLYDFLTEIDNPLEFLSQPQYSPKIMRHFSGDEFQNLLVLRNSSRFTSLCKSLENGPIKYVTIFDENYPHCFKELDVPPFIIYYVGDYTLLGRKSVAMVGTRNCTRYGAEITEKFAREIAKAGFCVVSGLADGIDYHAHAGTLDVGGKAIAVLAGGLNYIYPAANADLARKIINQGGLIISEQAPDSKPQSYTFIQRNRLIAAASDGVVVTEAGEKSGALHTVNFALDLGKDIFAVPGNVNSKSSEGTNKLIKQFYTTCSTSSDDVLSVLNSEIDLNKTTVDVEDSLNEQEKLVIDLLKSYELHIDEIVEKTKINLKTLTGLLTMLEIRGLIRRLPSNYYKVVD